MVIWDEDGRSGCDDVEHLPFLGTLHGHDDHDHDDENVGDHYHLYDCILIALFFG